MNRRYRFIGILLSTFVAFFSATNAIAAEEYNGVPIVTARDDSDNSVFENNDLSTDSESSDRRTNRIETQLKDQSDLTERVEKLQEEVQSLNGKLDEQTHALKVFVEQQEKLNKDFDQRLSNSDQKRIDSKIDTNNDDAKNLTADKPDIKPVNDNLVKTTEDTANNNISPEEEKHYVAAYELIKTKQFEKASVQMRNFLRDYPNSYYAAHAHYWLGEIALLQGDNDNAKTEFDMIISKYPKSPKVADAHLKLGSIYAQKGLIEKARKEFVKVQKQFPDTPAARLATARLQTLNQ